MAAATRRFAEYGFVATTVRQIADDVNVLSGSLYHHFATKEEMLDAVVRDAVFAQRDRARAIADLAADPETKLVTLLRAELKAMADQQEVHAIIFNERKFFRRSEDFRYLMEARRETYDAWVEIIEQGAQAGLFRAETDRYLTISTILRMLTSGADWYQHEDGSPIDLPASYSLDALCGFYTEFVLRGLRVAERASEPVPGALDLINGA